MPVWTTPSEVIGQRPYKSRSDTFTATGSAITSEHGSGTGTVRQYVRFRAARTGGSCTPVVTFARL